MATKSSIHIKPCNIASSEAHNRRTAEYMRNIGESRIYVVPELSTDNEQWINPDFGTPELRTHYMGHHSATNFPAQRRRALAERSAGSGRQRELPSR